MVSKERWPYRCQMVRIGRSLSVGACVIGLLGCRPGEKVAQSDPQAAQEAIAQLAQQAVPSPPSTAATPSSSTADNSQAATQQADIAQAVKSIDDIEEGQQYRQALRALDRGQMQTVNQIRQALASSGPYAALADALQAFVLVKEGQFQEALSIGQRISAIPALRAEAYVIGGEVFQRQNQLFEAIGAFNSALELDPEHVRATRWLGIVYYDIGSMRAATTQLRKVGQLDPEDINSLLLSAKINQEYEQYQEAILDYQQVRSRPLPPNLKIFVQVKLAECLCLLRKLDEAREALKDCPTAPAVVATEAAIAEAAGDFEQAARLAREALEHSPNQRAAAMVLARVSVTERQWAEALKILRPIVEAQPFDHESRLLLGRALIGSGEKEAGQVEVKRATELKNDFLKFAELHQTAMSQPGDAAIRFQLGEMAQRLGKLQLARSWYATALGLDPELKGAQDALNRLNDQQ